MRELHSGDDRLDAPIADDGFLHVSGGSGSSGVGPASWQRQPQRLCDCGGELWRARPGKLWHGLAFVANLIPECFFSLATRGVEPRSIWSEELARGTGPSDSCFGRAQGQVYEAVGRRVIVGLFPLWLLAVIVLAIAFSIRISVVPPAGLSAPQPAAAPTSNVMAGPVWYCWR